MQGTPIVFVTDSVFNLSCYLYLACVPVAVKHQFESTDALEGTTSPPKREARYGWRLVLIIDKHYYKLSEIFAATESERIARLP